MPLTALDIYKLLPKTNCGECGFPTCLAFAMQLATKKAAIDACPYASDDAKATLAGAAAPPIRLVAFGPPGRRIELGRETVLFRHEETFYHPPAIAVRLQADRPSEELRAELQRVASLQFERVGQVLRVEAVALEHADGAEPFVAAAREADAAGLALLLCSDDPSVLDAAASAVAASRPVLYAATASNWEAMAQVARKHGCPLAVRGQDLQELADLTPRLMAAGVSDLLLDSGARGQAATLADLTQIRRLALRKLFRPLGYPALAFVTSEDPLTQVVEGTAYICKYAAVVVTPALQPWQALALVTARQNIYTDPQKPIQVEPGIHTVGAPDADSPVLVTTNFSLTYFTVEADTEASRLPAWMVVVNTEGQSVMTAWAADKFNAETIAKTVESSGIAERVKHRRLIIPGGVAAISGKLEELCGWQVMVGPRESAGIPAFLRTHWKQVATAAS
ncbi:MAG: acetyl-CoA decarbonylase/synthase complex subunit gamma [Armatimonadota bacterium]|nr:acetyl-CoA decarbonylase/synthase complex subunit gamma [Armatimonadota bacterium]MDR7426596.1 acetyl-CoA decarbonylase/synthase complex subunit gamma [Armatimonadota bacterium]MDR7463695.1 acetyl-CoA decarbonylase/synthase complex subunit gamma [Armatimonadota bacterium]MDR7468616.1 acetyl-CoA decarbonylase/synthase complex subunit gamma [Armatimonadota bacterium]MDR7473739.1 acetyl-CoA decarbonylase/synthase complex subunit gamma [Armatimonadota bacterium]